VPNFLIFRRVVWKPQRRQSRPLLAAPEGSLDGRFLATQADALRGSPDGSPAR